MVDSTVGIGSTHEPMVQRKSFPGFDPAMSHGACWRLSPELPPRAARGRIKGGLCWSRRPRCDERHNPMMTKVTEPTFLL